ncbi:hypothetical protein EDE15_1954 [Edaphobacter aggregans]|uniref:Uncharacterized protein n=1 Tax=Edaphobacter aggregans TaxID=570835 RepID=A0A428MI42_9BACT|nr:hypothetical protein EDE15_1954 [Edaphobacter aggregans]
MRRLASIVTILLLLSTAAPVLACMTGSSMSREESACCRAMHGNCGRMAKMGCCQTEVRTDVNPQIVTKTPSVDLHWAVVDWLAPAVVDIQTITSSLLGAFDEHSPPGLIAARTTVLRI